MIVRFQLLCLGKARGLTQAGGGFLFPEDVGVLRWM